MVEEIKRELCELLPREDVEWAFRQEARNAALAGLIDLHLRGKKRERASQLLKELGADEFEREYEKKFGEKVDTVERARRFWGVR